MRWRNALSVGLILGLAVALLPVDSLTLDAQGQGAGPAGAGWVPLAGHVAAALSQATPVAADAQAPSQPLTLTVVLRRGDAAGFDAFLRGVEDPRSPTFRHFASQADLASRYGPTQQAYDAVLAYLQQQGFTLVRGSTNRLTLTVQGTRGQAERAFNVPIGDFQLGTRRVHANLTEPSVPIALASYVQAIDGLANLAEPHPSIAQVVRDPAAASAAPNPARPMSLATAYNFGAVRTAGGTPANGAGQTIGLVEFDAFFVSDVANWLGSSVGPCAGLGNSCVNGFLSRGTIIQFPGAGAVGPGEGEVLLDVDTVMGMAQGANYRVYESCANCPGQVPFPAMFNAMLSDGVTVISNSWFSCDALATQAQVTSNEMVLQNAAAAGVSVFTASGDHGSTCAAGSNTYPNNVDVPADAPHGTAVGGTTLQVGPGNVYQSETWWNDTSAAHGCSSLPCAGGFGSSTFFAAPPWQAGLAGSMRSVPDVVADGDPSTGIQLCQQDFGGCPQMIGGQPLLQGGTSMAAPEWAAGIALINQALGHLTGNWNQVLYAQRASNAFHPPSSIGSDFAHVGLGSFDLGSLAAVLQPAPAPTSTAVLPTSTPGPPTATPIPRPNVGVGVAPNPAAHTLQTTLVARNTCAAANQLQSIQFTRLTNATVDVPASLAATVTAPGTVTLAGNPATINLTVHRVNAGQAATVEMIVTDGCGAWPTFVGGGPSAF